MTETAEPFVPGEIVPHEKQEVAAVTPMQMLQIAIEKGADLDQMSKLMDLHERWEAAEARRAYVVAMSRFKACPPEIRKNKSVAYKSTAYDYLDLQAANQAIVPALSKQGIHHSWSVNQGDNLVTVTCTLTHEGGHSESVTMSAPPDATGSKNAIQAIASTTSYLERYTLLAATGLAAGDMDDDGGTGVVERITEGQIVELEARLTDAGITETALIAKFPDDITSLEDIPAKDFERAKQWLLKKKEASG